MKRPKCIIIGSGLGGLSCGVILAKNGYDVTILEQEAQIGGCLQCFKRKGIKFETGMHFIGSAAKGQTLQKLMRYLNIDDVKLSALDSNAYDVVNLNNNNFSFANGREAFIEQMASYFPKEKDNLVKYFSLIELIANASSLHSLKYAESDIAVNTEYQLRSINDVLSSIFKDPLLCDVLVGNLPLYAAEKDKTPFSQHAFIMDFYNQSTYRVVGGSDNISNALIKSLSSLNANVITNSKVVRIECDEHKATGVTTANGDFYAADVIISDTHPNRTLEMLDTKLIRPAFRNRVTSIRNTVSGFSVYLHFKKDTVPYMNSNYYSYKNNTPWNCENYTNDNWPLGYLYMHLCHEDKAQYAESGIILSYMHISELEKWVNTTVGKRGADYEAYKEAKAQILIHEVEKCFPNIKGCIENYYTSTPLTYRDYTGTQDGSMYGIAKDISLGASCRVPHKTKVPNLLLTGQNINSHGMLGVLVGTIVTCSELIGAENIYNQIVVANE